MVIEATISFGAEPAGLFKIVFGLKEVWFTVSNLAATPEGDNAVWFAKMSWGEIYTIIVCCKPVAPLDWEKGFP